MTVTRHTTLAAVVEAYDATGEPPDSDTVVERAGGEADVVAGHLDALVDMALLTEGSGGYRPTVTGREFLALDLETGSVVVDVVAPDDSNIQ